MSDSQPSEKNLLKAAKDGRLDIVKKCIKAKINVNCRDKNQATPLHLAARGGNREVSEYLVQQGAELNVKDVYGNTPFKDACIEGHSRVVNLLLSQGCDFRQPNNKGFTPLHSASQEGFLVIVKELLEAGAQVNCKNKEGSTPLYMAAKKGHLQVCKLLLQHGADLKARCLNGDTVLSAASLAGHVPVVEWLLTQGCLVTDTNDKGFSPLHDASQEGHLEVVKILIDIGAKVNLQNKDGATSFFMAAQYGHLPVCVHLFQQGANLNVKLLNGHTPLTAASLNGKTPVVEWLLSNGCPITNADKKGLNSLHFACQEGHLELATLLTDRGADVNSKTKQGYTPLHLAALSGQFDICKFLYNKSADIYDRGSNGRTLFHFACQGGHLSVIEWITSSLEFDINDPDRDGSTGLHVACNFAELKAVQCLVDSGANVDAKDNNSRTPLYYAALKDQRDTFDYLLSKGAKIDINDTDGRTLIIEYTSNRQVQARVQIDDKSKKDLQEQFEQQKDHSKKNWSELERQYFVQTCLLHILLAGETFFGKTSLARSLLLMSAYTAEEDDRTRVLDYWSLRIGVDKSVTLYDLGGHDSYRMLTHLFHNNSQQTLTMILHDILELDYSITCQWLTDIITRSPRMQVWFVLTKYDLLKPVSLIKQYKDDFIYYVDKYLEAETKSLKSNIRALSDDLQISHVRDVIDKYDLIRKELNNGENLHLVSCKNKKDILKLHSSISEVLRKPSFKICMLPEVQELYTRLGKLGIEQSAERLEAERLEAPKQKTPIYGKKKGESEPNNFTERSNQPQDKNTEITRKDQKQTAVDGHKKQALLEEYEKQRQLQEHRPFLHYTKFEDVLVTYQEILSEKGLLSQNTLESDLEEALQTLNSHGLIFWFHGTKKLKSFIFNDISSFVNMLKSLFVPNIEQLYCKNLDDDDKLRNYIEENFFESDHDHSVSRLSKQGLMDVPLLKTLTSKFDFHEHHGVVIDLLQHLSIAHRTTDDNFIFFPWYLSDSTPEDIDSLLTEMKTFTKETVCWQISLQGHLPGPFYHNFCVQVYKCLLPDADTQKRKVCKSHLSARIDDVEILIHHQRRENEKDQINVHVKSPVYKPAFDKSWQFIHECEKAFNHLRRTWWYGFGSYLTFECPSCPLHGETCNGSWPLNTVTEKTCQPDKKYSCPKKENRIFPAALICKLSTNDDIAAECLKELCQHLNNCQPDPEYGKKDLKDQEDKETQQQVSECRVKEIFAHKPNYKLTKSDLENVPDLMKYVCLVEYTTPYGISNGTGLFLGYMEPITESSVITGRVAAVLTSCHVMQNWNPNQPGKLIFDKYKIYDGKVYSFSGVITNGGKLLDYALLFTSDSKVISRFQDVPHPRQMVTTNEPPSENETMVLLGHPHGSLMLADHVNILDKAFIKTKYLKDSTKESKGTNLDLLEKPFSVIYNCTSFHGASGAPCFKLCGGGRADLVCIHTGGIYLNNTNPSKNDESDFEFGIQISQILHDINGKIQTLGLQWK